MLTKMNTIRRMFIALLLGVLVLSGCTPADTTRNQPDDGTEILFQAIDSLRGLQTFRMNIIQGGDPYEFYFQLGANAPEIVTVMSRAEGAYIAPNILWANARIRVRGLNVNVGLFAQAMAQYIKPLSSGSWLEFEYAPGFDAAVMMEEGRGFDSAIRRMTDVEYIGRETRNGREVFHVRGDADGQTVNDMLFGLLYILEDLATVDVYIDATNFVPRELILTLPDTAKPDLNTDDTFWRIEIYDDNEAITIDAPNGDITAEIESAEPQQERNPLTYWLWVMIGSGIVGAIATPIIFKGKGRRRVTGFIVGAIAGTVGSLLLLLPLWLYTPQGQHPRDDKSDKSKTSDDAPQKMSANPWVVMAFIAIPVFVGSLDLTVVSAFMPELLLELGLPLDTGLDDASWVVTVYLLAYTISLTFTGRLSDLIGRRWVYVISLVTFIIGSIWIAVAHTFPTDWLFAFYRSLGMRPDISYVNLQVIIAGRAIEAIGAGALVPVSLAIVGDMFPPERRARPLGLVAAMDTLGWVLGPVYGGVFLQFMSWQGLFWMNVPLTLLALFSVLYATRQVPSIKVQGGFDYVGTALIAGALTALTLGLGSNIDLSGASTNLDNLSALPDYALPMLVMGGIAFVGFLFVEGHAKDPLIGLGMFKRRNLSAASIVNLLVGYCLFIGLVSVPLLVNLRLENTSQIGEAALQTGILLSTLTLPMAFAAIPGGLLSEKIGIRNTIMLGLALATGGFLWMWQTWTIDISNTLLGIEMAIVGTGIGLTFSPVSTAIINSAYDHERGVASALVIILRLIGMTVSISTLSSIMYYRAIRLAGEQATAGGTIGFEQIFNSLDAVVGVLGEMGLIGAVLAGLALIPAAFIGQKVRLPDDENDGIPISSEQTQGTA